MILIMKYIHITYLLFGLVISLGCNDTESGRLSGESDTLDYSDFGKVTLPPEYSAEAGGSKLAIKRKEILRNVGFLPRFLKISESLSPKTESLTVEDGHIEVSLATVATRDHLSAKKWYIDLSGKRFEISQQSKPDEVFSVSGKRYFLVDLVFSVDGSFFYKSGGSFRLLSSECIEGGRNGLRVSGIDIGEIKVQREKTDPIDYPLFEIHIPFLDQIVINK